MNLTPKQLQILKIIRDSRVVRGFSPTMQEIADELGVSKVTVFEHIETLIRKGALVREPNKARSLSIPDSVPLPDESSSTRFPLVGRIAAGVPIEKFAQTDELDIGDMFGPHIGQVGGTFALQVEGESMRDEGILDGDYVIIERSDTARNGERVVALLEDGQTTLKTYFKETDHIRLQPANPEFEPIRVKDCHIQGKVVGVLRRY
ncbi:MAG: transcriptional repressor LexA [Planctomycetota bacterium]|jgi:repressor LexA